MSNAQALAEVQEGHTRILTKELLEVLKLNRGKHAEEFAIAMKGWHVAYADALVKVSGKAIAHAQKVRDEGVTEQLNGRALIYDLPPRPESYVKDYDRITRRMEMSQDEEQFISHHDFDCFVRDEWDWKAGHIETFNNYSGGAK